MNKEYINFIVDGLVDTVKSDCIYDYYNYLDIDYKIVDDDFILLHGNEAVYHRSSLSEIVYISEKVKNKEFVLAHELGHAILHVDTFKFFYNSLLNKGQLELQADYFATKLIYRNFKIEDGIETYEQLANSLGVNEKIARYIID